MTLLENAIAYSKKGWYVFPCREKPGTPFLRDGKEINPLEKHPYTSNGLLDASIDEDQIRAWWTRWPNALIGINAGKSGLFVVDIDKKHVNGLETFSQWNINDTAGLHSITPSGGIHIVFTGTGKSTSNAKTGIDTRGEGGYFIVPPSKILQGKIIGEYRMVDDWSLSPGVIPDGLMSKLFPDNTTEFVRGNTGVLDGQTRALSRFTLHFLVEGAMPGERNASLFKVLADFAGCGYSREKAEQAVFPVCQRIGLDRAEFNQVLENAYSKPRTASIPDTIQEKILKSGKSNVLSKITQEEQSVMESVLLACMIADNTTIPAIMDILLSDDFGNMKNRFIYRAILRLYTKETRVDSATVASEIQAETDKVSLNDIAMMVNSYYETSENVITYAEIIKEKASLRKIEAVMDNKEKYIKKGSLVEVVSSIEKDISDAAIYGGAKSSNVVNSNQAIDMVDERLSAIRKGEISQLQTGFIDYDKNIGGIFTDELIMVAGRAGDGKSALALTLANHVAFSQKKAVLFFSLEMSIYDTVTRLVCQMTGIPFKKVSLGAMSAEEWKEYKHAVDKIASSKLYFDDSSNMGVSQIRSKIRKMSAIEKPALIVIDQLEQVAGYDKADTHDQLNKISYDIRGMAKDFNTPIILVHQLNRNVTNRMLKNPEVQLSDLNQAGEKAPNQVWAISHKRDSVTEKIIQSKIKVMKNRNGPTMEFAVTFFGEKFLFVTPALERDRTVFHNVGNTMNHQGGDDDDGSHPF